MADTSSTGTGAYAPANWVALSDDATAPVATVLALVAWMRGDGALATMSLQRAAEEPGYRLRELAERLIVSGTDPAIWRESLRGLSESGCLDPSGRGTHP